MHKLYEHVSLAVARVLAVSLDDLRREDGQGATEYALVIGFVVVGLGIGLATMGTAISDFLGRVAGDIGGLYP